MTKKNNKWNEITNKTLDDIFYFYFLKDWNKISIDNNYYIWLNKEWKFIIKNNNWKQITNKSFDDFKINILAEWFADRKRPIIFYNKKENNLYFFNVETWKIEKI